MALHRVWFVLAIVATLGGCGGGGGGSGGAPSSGGAGASTPTTSAPTATSGLVPATPATGATLYGDAASLRVLRAGAVWTYHGVEKPSGESAVDFNPYTNTVTHAAAASGIMESGTHPFKSDPETDPIRYENGAYVSTNQIAFSENTPAQTVNVIELRSPVKVNDQYVSIDKHIADSGVDLDGDKVNDALDVAVYSTVAGEETVDLPNRRQVKAVHVDMHLRARVTFSKTGTMSSVYDALQSTWYAPGIGIVKSRLEEPNNSVGLPNRVVTEILDNWDGLTEGLGHTPTAVSAAPPDAVLSGPPLQYLIDVVGFDTQAVAVGQIPDQPLRSGLAVAQLDTRGNVVASRSYTLADLFPSAPYYSEPHAVRVGNEVRIFAHTGNQQLSMAALDATGQRILRPAIQVVNDPQLGYDTDLTSYRVASDDAGIWIGWVRSASDGQVSNKRLVAQHIDANGQALGPVVVASAPESADISRLSMALDGSRLAFSWMTINLQPSWRLATLDTAAGTSLSDQVLGLTFDDCRFMATVALQPGLATTCGNGFVIGAARLDANGNRVLSSGATLLTDVLKAPWLLPLTGSPGVYGSNGGQLTVSVYQNGQFWPEGRSDGTFNTVFQTSGIGPLAASEPILLARITPVVNVRTSVKLGNHLLLVGSDSFGHMNTTVVWLPN